VECRQVDGERDDDGIGGRTDPPCGQLRRRFRMQPRCRSRRAGRGFAEKTSEEVRE
jgi:hypothetical protein